MTTITVPVPASTMPVSDQVLLPLMPPADIVAYLTSLGYTVTAPASPPSPPSPAGSLGLGSYNGAANVAGAAAFASETGITPAIYSDYLDGSSWGSMVGSAGNAPWVIGQLKGKLGNQRLLLSVPLVNAGFKTDQAALASYAASPAMWDASFSILANNLVNAGFGNAIIRLMWEPDSGIYSSDDLVSAANFAKLWQAAVTAMRNVSGQAFQFAWYWGANFDAKTNTAAYPGSAYVDFVTFDFYDQSWATTGTGAPPYNGQPFTPAQEQFLWTNSYNVVLGALVAFAKSVNKPIGIGEWGVITRSDNHGGGDDPTFVTNFVAWMRANNVAWASYFNFNSGGNSVLSAYPKSLAAFKASLVAALGGAVPACR